MSIHVNLKLVFQTKLLPASFYGAFKVFSLLDLLILLIDLIEVFEKRIENLRIFAGFSLRKT